jgi:DMSO/TMAO reductase YedYZ molybdopterin-dependent catalytic subunit
MPDPKGPPLTGSEAEQAMRTLSRRSFTTGALAAVAGLAGWTSLRHAAPEDGIPWPLRRVQRFNEWLGGSTFSANRLAPTYSRDQVQRPGRVNGHVGLADGNDLGFWRLRVQHPDRAEQLLTLEALSDLPRVEMITQLKCVEGWSQVCQWEGVRFADFAAKLGLTERSCPYVYLATPDEQYYVGLDMASALHPQTLLCDKMNGAPLTPLHGAPLRLAMTVKYGYKQIKHIGMIRFQDERPPDYWAERRYDWYAGL